MTRSVPTKGLVLVYSNTKFTEGFSGPLCRREISIKTNVESSLYLKLGLEQIGGLVVQRFYKPKTKNWERGDL